MWAHMRCCCMGMCKLRPLRDTIDVQPKNVYHCNLGLEGMNNNCSLAGYILRLSYLMHVFINTD